MRQRRPSAEVCWQRLSSWGFLDIAGLSEETESRKLSRKPIRDTENVKVESGSEKYPPLPPGVFCNYSFQGTLSPMNCKCRFQRSCRRIFAQVHNIKGLREIF